MRLGSDPEAHVKVAPVGDAFAVPPCATDWGSCRSVEGPDGATLLAPVVASHPSWCGLPISLQRLPGRAVARDLTLVHPTLAVAVFGRGRRRYSTGHCVHQLYSSPSMFELYGQGNDLDEAVWEGVAGEIVALQLPVLSVASCTLKD